METSRLLPSSAVLARAFLRNLALVLCPARGPEMLWFHISWRWGFSVAQVEKFKVLSHKHLCWRFHNLPQHFSFPPVPAQLSHTHHLSGSFSDPQPLPAQFSTLWSPYCFIQPCTHTSPLSCSRCPNPARAALNMELWGQEHLSVHLHIPQAFSTVLQHLRHFQFHKISPAPMPFTSSFTTSPWTELQALPHLVSPKRTEPTTTHPQHPSPVHAHSMSMCHPDPPAKGHGNRENTFLLSWHPDRELF